MRVELSLQGPDDAERDVAVTAAVAATVADLSSAIAAVTGDDVDAVYAGGRRLPPGTRIEAAPLCRGARLAVGAARAPRRSASSAQRLHVVGGPDAGVVLGLSRRSYSLGRAPESDLVIGDPRVSRRHADLTVTPHGITVRDCGSTNGTWLDGVRIDHGRLVRPGQLLRVGDSLLTVRSDDEPPASTRPGPDATRWVNRGPRPPIDATEREIELPEHPGGGRPERVQWATAAVSAGGGALLAAVLRAPQFLLFALLAPLTLLGAAAGDRLHWRRSRRRQAAGYRRRLAAARADVTAATAVEGVLRRRRDPDPAAALEVARLPGGRLWERRRSDVDLLRVRLGLGSVPSAVRVRLGATVRPAAILESVPVAVDLRAGPLGLAAPAAIAHGLARWVLCQLAVLVSPADLEIALVLSGDDAPWRWARWLPHVGARVATSAAERQGLLADLRRTVETRLAERGHDSAAWAGPWLVVVLDRARDHADVSGLTTLLGSGTTVGVTTICVDEHENHLPSACQVVVRATGGSGTELLLRGLGEDRRVVADRVAVEWADATARALAPLADPAADAASAVPKASRLVDLLGMADVTVDSVLERWRRSDGTPWTVIGHGAEGPVGIDLRRDGPHMLVAGTTGSGKSELLQSLVAGLATLHPPQEISFVLIDYKGGAAFADCARLPHTAAVVTDLDPHLTRRALQSFDAELRRREELLARAGARDLPAYRNAGGPEPLARLVIVVDEFAALADDQPEFLAGLVAIAQRGRSLGVHLVLATQRPGGAVSPEIRANTSIRVALRVTDAAESSDVIGIPDAARIDRRRAGRAFLRVGTAAIALQTARVTGAASPPPEAAVRMDLLDEWLRPVIAPVTPDDGTSDLELLVDAASEAAARSGTPAVRRPWLPPLPAALSCSSLPGSPMAAAVPLGLLDLPARQRQEPFVLDLAAAGSLLIVGAPRSGRTTALVTLAASAAERNSPDAVHLYAIDCAGGGLDGLRRLPHCGTSVSSDDVGAVESLLRNLQEEVSRRTGWLAAQRLGSCAEAVAGGHHLPLMLLLVDGWDGFVDASEHFDAGRGTELLLTLIRAAPAAGLTIVITGGRAALTPRLGGAVGTKLLLRLADRGDYGIAGIALRAVPETLPPGRAVRAPDGAEVQLAHLGADASRREQDRVVQAVAARWGPPRREVESTPIRLRPLPSRVDLADLSGAHGLFRVGVGGDAAEPVAVDLFAGQGRLLVAGPPRSGRSTVLRSALAQLFEVADSIVVAAPTRSPLVGAARDRRALVVSPEDRCDPAQFRRSATGRVLLLIDDSEAFSEAAVGESLTDWVRSAPPGLAVVVSGRSDELAVTYRGVAAEVRRAGCALLLHPDAADGDLVGLRLPRRRPGLPPGRGLLVADPEWSTGAAGQGLPIQVALP